MGLASISERISLLPPSLPLASKFAASPTAFMSSKVNGLVHSQMAVAALRGHFRGEHFGRKTMERKPSGKRRVFVQTENGRVLGVELDRGDNAHTVKRKLQLALDIPTDESSLTYGDTVLKNDLSAVRNDSPLLLTRNSMHRSSSTPCLSPTCKDLQPRDQSGPIEILGYSNHFSRTKLLVKEIVKAMNIGIDPILIFSGLGGAYYFRDCEGNNVAIIKPTDEEPYAPNNPKGFVGKVLGQPGLKRSVRVGETGFREVAAFLLDYDHFANVPCTALVKITHSIFNINDGMNGQKNQKRKQISKIASLQQYITHDFDASDHGTSSFPVAAVHRIGILDVRILNTDRHAGNLLVRKFNESGCFGKVELVPIDHGLCLPEDLEDPYFEWIHWPQASIPFSEDELEYISHLDPFQDCEMLRMELPMIREACLRVLVLCTIFLKQAAAFGLCLSEIGEMMSREFRGQVEEPSELESLCIEARRLLEDKQILRHNVNGRDNEELQFNIDCEEQVFDLSFNPDENAPAKTGSTVENGHLPYFSKLSMTMKNISIGEKSWRHECAIQKIGYLGGISSGNRSVNEQLPASTSFIKLADMSEEEWVEYLDHFQKLLYPAFTIRRTRSVVQKQKQRLGTSCRF